MATATAMGALLMPAIAAQADDLQFSAVKLSLYDSACTPLSAKTKEMVDFITSTIDSRERLRMFTEIKAAMVGVPTAYFCEALRPAVQQLESK
jgi:hypothetical protein